MLFKLLESSSTLVREH